MKIAVNDANILFDLIDLELLHYLFQLEYSFCTTDMVIDEFKKKEQKIIIQNAISSAGLSVMSIDDIRKLFLEQQKNPKLSIQDCSVLIVAKEQNALILTGDNYLRKTAEKDKIEVHGILWVFDTLIENKLISYQLAHSKLSVLLNINNRLPKKECDLRLEKWWNKI